MKLPVVFLLLLTLAGPLSSQTHERVTFHHEEVLTSGSVFVSGDLPELGGNDFSRSIEMIEVDTGVWEVVVSLPVNRDFQYRFLSRYTNTAQVADPDHGTELSEFILGATSTVTLDPATKNFSYRGGLANPVLHWRQDEAEEFHALSLTLSGGWWVGTEVGESNRSVEFYLTDGLDREPPGDENFLTRIDTIFIQDGGVFNYSPETPLSPHRRDYDPADLPVISSQILGENRPYRVLLPRGYDEQMARYYPVLYCLDGQRLLEEDISIFGATNPRSPLDPDGETMSKAIHDGLMQEVIVVGIDVLHVLEYSVFRTPYHADGIVGEFEEFADFLRLELIPEINERYRTLAGAENVAVMGFESQAAGALYLAWDFPDVFGKAGTLNLGNHPGLANVIAFDPPRKVKLSIDTSTSNYPKSHDLRNLLAGKTGGPFAIGEDLRYLFVPGESSKVESYRTRLPEMLSFLFPASEKVDTSAANATNPYWLSFYGLRPIDWDLDGDNDGWSTRDEYHFGTSPIDPESFPDYSFEIAQGQFSLDFQSSPGVRYQLQESENLVNWDLIGDPLPGTGEEFTGSIEFDESARPKLFFRLGVEAPGDADRDGLSSIEESILLGTNPNVPDTDRDGFSDGEEVLVLGTDPLVPNFTGGIISGQVFDDADGDSLLAGETPVAGASVFLDLNLNLRLDDGETSQATDAGGGYRFEGVKPGLYHVVQEVPPGSVQTFPGRLPGQPDGLADRVVSLDYVPIPEAPTLMGNYAVDDHSVPTPIHPSRPYQEMDIDVVLKPIGDRARAFALGLFNTTEFVALTKDTVLTVEFEDEEIIDGPGHDFQVVSLDNIQDAGEKIEIWVGASLEEMVFLNVIGEAGGAGIDLGRFGIDYPIRYVRLKSLNNNGSSFGYDFVGFQAINFKPLPRNAHLVEVKAGEEVSGVDFGRFGRDLPPHVVISHGGSQPLAGGELAISVSASDDHGEPSLEVIANGSDVVLDAEGQAIISTPFAGEMVVTAIATDSAGQPASQSLHVTVRNADGSLPNDPNSPPFAETNSSAPRVVFHRPGAGESLEEDTGIVASITHENLSSWKLEYAPVNLIDPYQLALADPDYILLNEGTTSLLNVPAGIFPATSLADGVYFLRISATANGVTGYSGQVIAVRTDASELFPSIEITSPAQDSLVSFLTEIEGSITSASPVREWSVEIAEAGELDLTNLSNPSGAPLTRLAGGSGVIDGKLATFDPTVLKNGTYLIKVTAWNDFGLGWTEGVVVNVCGENKPGRLRVEYRDLEADLAGIPIQIVRAYDSLDKDRVGDFGAGWSMTLADPDIRDTDPDGGAAFTTEAWRIGTRIYLNSPGGERIGFTFGVELSASGFLGSTYRGVFTPDPGVYETLELPQRDLGFLVPNPDGTLKLSFIGVPFNPDVFILTTKNGDEYTYDETEGLLDIKDPAGNAVIFTENAIRHSSGATVSLERDSLGRIKKIVSPAGAEWTYHYDDQGDLISVSDPAAVTTTFAYSNHYLTSVTDPLGRQGVRYEYDATGRLAAIIDENGNRSEQTWDLEGFSGTRSDFRGNVTTIHYDERGNVLREIAPNGGETIYEYSDPENPDLETKITDARGYSRTFKYDENGNKTKETPAVGNSIDWDYDDRNRLVTYTPRGEFGRTYNYGENGLLEEIRSGNILLKKFTYTADGQISVVEENDGSQRFYRYDGPFGQLDRVKNSLSEAATMSFNANGLPASATDLYGTDQYDFDDSGRLLTETNALGQTTTITYQGDQVASVTDPNGIRTDYSYDTNNSLISERTGMDEISYEFDPDGNRTAVIDSLGNGTAFTYDAGGKVLTETDPSGATTRHAYDLAGNRIETIDRLGRKRTFEYDGRNRLAAERWHAGDDSVVREILFEYSRTNLLSQVTDGELEYSFGSLGTREVTSMSVTFPGSQAKNIRYEYDRNDRLLKQVYGVADYHRVQRNSNGDATLMSLNTPDGDERGRVELLRGPGRQPSTIRRFSSAFAPDLVATTELDYDAVGRLRGMTHVDPMGASLGGHVYSRNPGGQITSTGDEVVTYGSRGEIAGVTRNGSLDESFQFDAQGNPTGAGVTVAAGNRLTEVGDLTMEWDAEGNLVRRTNGATGQILELTWDYRNRLTRVEVTESGEVSRVVEYEYDFRDLQISRSENGEIFHTVYDRNEMPFMEFKNQSETPSAVFYYAPDVIDHFLAEWREGEGIRWFLTDHIGSIRTVIDQEGNVVGSMDFDAFGRLRNQAGNVSSLGFAGRPLDPTTGLIYKRGRFYDPLVGRFISEDPIGFDSGEVNLYRYAANDPYNLVDPSGQTAAVSYGTFTKKIAKRTIKYGKKVGKQLDKCFTGIAESLEQAAAGGGAGGGDVGTCKDSPGLP